jgi:hypothetical protein
MTEQKVTYMDGDTPRVLRGHVEDNDDRFITVKRRDGNVQINKTFVVKIE